MKAIWNGTVIAESDETIYLEGNHYFPPDSVDFNRLSEVIHGATAQLPARLPDIVFWMTQPFLGNEGAAAERERARQSVRSSASWTSVRRVSRSRRSGTSVSVGAAPVTTGPARG
jgi:Domain of unknown function (DUF427)